MNAEEAKSLTSPIISICNELHHITFTHTLLIINVIYYILSWALPLMQLNITMQVASKMLELFIESKDLQQKMKNKQLNSH